jgi:hypothetical protein
VEHNNAVALREFLMARLTATSSDKPLDRKDERGTSP